MSVPDVFALAIGMTALVIPIIVVLSFRHIRELEKIKRMGSPDVRDAAEMRRELAELKELVMRQTIALDGGTEAGRTTPPVFDRDRLSV